MAGSRSLVLAAPALVLALLAGCGGDGADGRAPDAPVAQTRPAGAAFERRCRAAAGAVTVAVRCPARLPAGGFERPRNYGDPPCAYLLNLEPDRFQPRAGTVFHLLFGGSCRAWDLRTRGGGWPAGLGTVRDMDRLRLLGTTPLEPGQRESERVALRVLRRARVGVGPALVLRNPPYPAGGIHGGHISIVWNARGAGYVVTGHAVASRARRDATPGPKATARAIATLLDVAVSMHR